MAIGIYWDSLCPYVRLEGAGSRTFLHGQTSADLKSIESDEPIQGCWLTATGRVRALLEIYLDSLGANVVIIAGNSQDLVSEFEKVIFPADQVKISSLGQIRRLHLLTSKNNKDLPEVVCMSEGVPLPPKWLERRKASFEEFESWRIRQGLPFGEGELNGENNPFELGLGDWVSLSKGCYLGQETLAKLANLQSVKQQIRFWRSNELLISPGMRLLNKKISEQDSSIVGHITSAMFDKITNTSFGLAMIRRTALNDEKLFLSQGLGSVNISLPDGFAGFPNS